MLILLLMVATSRPTNPSPADKATVNRTFTVSNGRTLTLPLLPLHSLEVASSPEAAAHVVEYVHDTENIGMPHVHMYRESGIILHPINKTTAHVLVVIDDENGIKNIAVYHHIYSILGYTLVFDETTCLVELPQESKSGDSNESPAPPRDMESVAKGASISNPNGKQTKLDFVGMEVA